MFDILNHKSSENSDPELDRFKELTRDTRVLDALYKFNNGETRFSLDIALQVQECINLSNIITARAQIISNQLFDAARSNQWENVHERLHILQERLDARQYQINDHLEEIIEWAIKYNIPPLSSLNTLFYKTTGIPRSKNELMSLRFIHAPNLGIKEIPLGIGYLPQIQGICFTGNEIREIPFEICEMSTVTILDIENNRIERIPENIGNMISLCQADFDGNNIHNVPKSILDLEMLSVLRLSKQRHGHPLHYRDAPIDESSQRVLAKLAGNANLRLYLND